MKNENEKKGLLERLLGSKKAKKGSCCCIQLEELPEENTDNRDQKTEEKDNCSSCCR